jgi:RNA polymerase sigma-70 factor (ECF subfamily)
MRDATWIQGPTPAAVLARPVLPVVAGPAESERVADRRERTTAVPDEDAPLVAAARAGDQAAFRALVERHHVRAHQLAWRMLRSAPDAEEVAQDAFVRAWRALPDFRGEARFATWLHRIVARLSLDRLETLSRRRRRETDLESASDVGVAPVERAGGLEAKLQGLVGGLSPVQQSVVRLFYYEDHSVTTVAVMLGMPENTVKTHLSRARAALRAAWLAKGETS